SVVQGTQVWLLGSQAGLAGSAQSRLVRQATHTPSVVSHSGVAPRHWLALVAEHWPQRPDNGGGWQAGRLGLVVQPRSSTQGAQACLTPSHSGSAGSGQSALVRQPTHRPALTSQ